MPRDWCKRLWDYIFGDSIFFVIKFGIAFTQVIKDDILEMEEEYLVMDYFRKLQTNSLSMNNEFYQEKCDINKLLEKANKIKLDPEEYIKQYEKKVEGGKDFRKNKASHSRDSFVSSRESFDPFRKCIYED